MSSPALEGTQDWRRLVISVPSHRCCRCRVTVSLSVGRGCNQLHIGYSKLTTLSVKYNNDKSRDFTDSTLPPSPLPMHHLGGMMGMGGGAGGGMVHGAGVGIMPTGYTLPPGYPSPYPSPMPYELGGGPGA